MSFINLDKLKIEGKFSNPYPLIIYSNLLEEAEIDNLQDILSDSETIFDKTVMGNRKTILKGTNNFENFLSKSQTGLEINSFFEREEVFKYFYNNLENLNKNEKNNFNLANTNFKFLKDYTDNAGPATNRNINFRIKNRLTKIFSKMFNDSRIFCDFDFSVASNGYWKEPHHDKEERVLSFLYYINNFESENGGNLEIYEYKKKPETYLREPDPENLNMIKKIEPKRGHLITFLSSPNSLHGVDVVRSNKQRYFFYGSYTSVQRVNWNSRNNV